MSFSELGLSLSSGSVWRAARRRSGVLLVCEAVSSVLGAAWILTLTRTGVGVVWVSMLVVGMSSVWALLSSTKMAPWKSALAWATIERQSPVPCPSMSHFFVPRPFPAVYLVRVLQVVCFCMPFLPSPGLTFFLLHIHPCSLPSISYFLPCILPPIHQALHTPVVVVLRCGCM